MENVVPTVIAAKHLFEKEHDPLLRDLLLYLKEIMQVREEGGGGGGGWRRGEGCEWRGEGGGWGVDERVTGVDGEEIG